MKYVYSIIAIWVQLLMAVCDGGASFYDDEDFDGSDLAGFAAAYGSSSESPKYNPDADLAGDGDVDRVDLRGFAARFGRSDLVAPEVTTEIGSFGGSVNTSSGAAVNIPPGALSNQRSVSVGTHSAMASLPAPAPLTGGGNFGPPGLTFDLPVTITLPLAEPQDPGTQLAVYLYDEAHNGWLMTEFSAEINPDGLTASAEVTHFTDYILIGQQEVDLLFIDFKQKYFENIISSAELFESFVDRFKVLIGLGNKKPWDFSAHYQNRNYACYQIVGIDYVLATSRAIPDPEDPDGEWIPIETKVFDRETGEKGSVAWVFLDVGDTRITDINQGEFQLTHLWDIVVHLRCTQPDLILEADKTELDLGEELTVKTSLICGSEGMENQQIIMSAFGRGSIDPVEITTSSDGEAEAKLSALDQALDCSNAPVTVVAQYESCLGQEQQSTVVTEAEFDVIFSLEGTWSSTEIADETDCEEGINTYQAAVNVSQTDNTITATWSGGWVSGDKAACTVSGVGGESEDNGYTYGGGSLTINPNGKSMTGGAGWAWVGIDPDTGEVDSCSGSSSFTLTRPRDEERDD